jgi:hypothetical protein
VLKGPYYGANYRNSLEDVRLLQMGVEQCIHLVFKGTECKNCANLRR